MSQVHKLHSLFFLLCTHGFQHGRQQQWLDVKFTMKISCCTDLLRCVYHEIFNGKGFLWITVMRSTHLKTKATDLCQLRSVSRLGISNSGEKKILRNNVKYDKVPFRVPFQWRKRNVGPPRMPFQWRKYNKVHLWCPFSGAIAIQGPLEFPPGGDNAMQGPLWCLSSGENVIHGPLGCPSSGEKHNAGP